MLFSSGTSGVPKSIKIVRKSLISGCLTNTFPGFATQTHQDVTLVAQPIAHIGGLTIFFFSAFQGANLVITDYPGSTGLLQVIQKYRITFFFAVPSVLHSLAKIDNLESFDLASIRVILTGATSPNFEVIKTLQKRSGNENVTIKHGYGATETYGTTFMTNENFETCIESIGLGLPGVNFRIADLKDPTTFITEPNLEGELQTRQCHPYLLYFNDPEKSATALTDDGFYKTGDLAYLIRVILTGATSPNFEVIKTLQKRSGNENVTIKHGYGATETYGTTFMTNENFETCIESIGLGLPGVNFRIADLKDPTTFITEPNLEGELQTRQCHPYLLYFNDPEKSATALTDDGFYKTGDLAYLNEDLNVMISGRIKEVIKFRGFSVSPAEIEAILTQHPLVQECSVVAKPKEANGEIPVAFVVLKFPDTAGTNEVEKELIAFVAESLADFKRIHRVYFIDDIPKNGSGKILKQMLVRKFQKE